MKRPDWKRTANSLRTLFPFWRAAVPRALIETFLMGAVLTASLASTRDQMPQDIIDEGFFFVGPTCALCYALRLRMPDTGRLWRRLVHEGVAGIGFGLLLGGSLLAVMYTSPDFDPLDAVFLLIVDVLALLIFRVGAWLWRFWDQVRRKRLLWALTHAHLTSVVLMMLFLATLSAIGDISDPDSPRFVTDNLLMTLVVLFNRIIVPFLSFMTILTGGMLLVALPPSAILSYFVARRTTRRLESLAAATQALRDGDLAARVPVVGEDEVAQLQDDFNVMAAELERAASEVQAEQDKVASLLQSRRELFANVSHELRTPVATIRGYLDSSLAGNSPQELQRDLDVMSHEVTRLQGLIDDLFTLARAQVDGLAVDLNPTDVGAVVQRRAEAIAPLAWQKGRVEVVVEVSPDLPPAQADAVRLEQVLVNLLRNGVRHTPPGGVVAVMVAGEADAIRIDVRDTGEGIPPDELPRVWERFYRGASARQDGPGAGLGLTLAKELVEAMGGTVGVESVVGQGSCFTVRLQSKT